jgi:hypothetical protein
MDIFIIICGFLISAIAGFIIGIVLTTRASLKKMPTIKEVNQAKGNSAPKDNQEPNDGTR